MSETSQDPTAATSQDPTAATIQDPYAAMGHPELVERCGQMQNVINQIHMALWVTLQQAGGQVVMTAEKLATIPPLGKIEWTKTDQGELLIRTAAEDPPGGPQDGPAVQASA